MQKGKGALEGNGRQQRTDLEGSDWGLKDKNVGERHELEGNTKGATTEDGSLAA